MIRGKKGDLEMYVIFLGVLVIAGYFLIAVLDIGNNVELIGETSLKLVNSFEASERVFFYLDASAEISAREAIQESLGGAGFISQVFKGTQEGQRCGKVVYPLFNDKEEVDKCLPDYKSALITSFRKRFNFLVQKYEPFKLNPDDFEVFSSKTSKGLSLKIVALSDLEMPIYSYVESYYADADKTRTQSTDVSDPYVKNEYGYMVRTGLISYSRGDGFVSKIVLHDTKTTDITETYSELSQGHRNYHYVIDTDGAIYQFAPEDRKTSSADCVKADNPTCQMEDVDKYSINIAFVGCSVGNQYCNQNFFMNQPTPLIQKGIDYSNEQISALKNLISDVALRNEDFVIDRQHILLSRQIDTSLNDPKDELVQQLNGVIIDSIKLLAEKEPVNNPPAGNGITGGVTAITGMVVPSDLLNRKPTTGVKTTIYFTPEETSSSWCSPTKGSCFSRDQINSFYGGAKTSCLAQGKGYCCIEDKDRGFYEEVKCQGSGRYNGKVYHTSTITTSSNSPTLEGFVNGITAKGTDPMPKRTVAVNPACIAYWTKMYLYFGEDNPWNGYYVAEDTGGAFTQDCKGIDVYAGVGDQAKNDALPYVSGKYPQIYFLDANFKLPDLDFSGTAGLIQAVAGSYYTRYSKNVEISGVTALFDNTFDFVKSTVQTCYNKQTTQERKLCVEDKANKSIADFGVNVTNNCGLTELKTSTIAGISGNDAVIKGTIKSISDIQEDSQYSQTTQQTTTVKYLLVEVDDGVDDVEIKITGEAVKLFDIDETVEQVNIPQEGETVIVNMSKKFGEWNIDIPGNFIVAPDYLNMNSLITVGKKLSDCATSSTSCECDLSFEGFSDVLAFAEEKISFDDTYSTESSVDIPVTVYKDETARTNNAKGFVINTKDYSNGLFFTVYNDGTAIIKNAAGNLPACVPKRETHLLCASIDDEYLPEKLNFALKI